MARRRAAALDELYRVRPTDFTRARQALVQRLRDADKLDEARKAQRRRRPTVAVWVVNQLARRDPDAVAEFIDAVQGTIRAQRTGAADFSASTARQHETMQRLSQHARTLLTEIDRVLSPDLVRRISWTLLGAAADANTRHRLRKGTLEAEHAAPDLAALGRMGGTSARKTRGLPSRAADRRRDGAKARQAQRAAKHDAARARQAERAADRLAGAAARRRRAAETSAREVDAIRERLRRAEAELAHRQTEARRASEEAARARHAAETPRTAA
jgi:hypothetical protein